MIASHLLVVKTSDRKRRGTQEGNGRDRWTYEAGLEDPTGCRLESGPPFRETARVWGHKRSHHQTDLRSQEGVIGSGDES